MKKTGAKEDMTTGNRGDRSEKGKNTERNGEYGWEAKDMERVEHDLTNKSHPDACLWHECFSETMQFGYGD